MTPERAIVAAILLCIAGAVITLLCARFRTLAAWVSFAVTAASAVLVVFACGRVWLLAPSEKPASFWSMPNLSFALRLHVDGLNSVFLLLAVAIAVPAALYSISYMQHYSAYGVARYYPNFLLFLAAMYGLLTTTDMMWFFFIFWQLMTLPGYALIRFERHKPTAVRAANKYLIMMQIACAFTLIGAQIVATAVGEGSLKYDFQTVSAHLPRLLAAQPFLAQFAFALFMIGFGIKMGMWPFGQVWLPDAHPAAPSPVSAMLSGVMIKTGVYGLIRYFLWLVPAQALDLYPLHSWGNIVAALGTVTLFTGTTQALQQEQSKRLLAYHSIGQIGYILLGTGICMALLPAGAALAPVAALALFGALLHVANHGLFKGLLFFNAGSMLYATGTQDLNRVSGLMRFMPITAVTTLVASCSISGVPLFNGFISKWTIYVAALRGATAAHYLVVCAIAAIFISGVTLASFIKFFGASFMSRASALVLACAQTRRLEPGWLMQIPQLFLALLCILLGLWPAIGFALVRRAISHNPEAVIARLADVVPVNSGGLSGAELLNSGRFVPLALVAVMALMFAVAAAASKIGGARRRTAALWLCGYATESDCYRYVAHNFYGELKTYFRYLGGSAAKAEKHP
ncbi:MAG TPA: proton-conducting transporter membrane subunit [Terriglobales bacterium]|nr:proton-conducting transporter membrane subunit [Terriglobales bacterium]